MNINLEQFSSKQECEASLKHKAELMAKMETQRESMANAIAQLEKKYEIFINLPFIVHTHIYI